MEQLVFDYVFTVPVALLIFVLFLIRSAIKIRPPKPRLCYRAVR
jgi:hypothetical protein